MRRILIRLFTFLGGIYFFLEFVLPPVVFGVRFDVYHEQITNGFVVVSAMAVGLGLINLLAVHGSRIVFKRKDWVNSLALLLGLFLMMWVTSFDWKATSAISSDIGEIFVLRDFASKIRDDAASGAPNVPPLDERRAALRRAGEEKVAEISARLREIRADPIDGNDPDFPVLQAYEAELGRQLGNAEASLSALVPGAPAEAETAVAEAMNALAIASQDVLNTRYRHETSYHVYTLLYDGLFVALGSAMFSLLGFYIAAAAYRAFRVRSAESALMMAAAIVVMLGQIPFGIWIWEGFPDLRLWLLSVPSGAAFRAIKIGAEVAGLIIAFRMWLSLESESFAVKD